MAAMKHVLCREQTTARNTNAGVPIIFRLCRDIFAAIFNALTTRLNRLASLSLACYRENVANDPVRRSWNDNNTSSFLSFLPRRSFFLDIVKINTRKGISVVIRRKIGR